MIANLTYENNHIAIGEFCYHEADAKGGNPYNTTFRLSVRSGGFAGEGDWECDIRKFRMFVDDLQKLYAFQAENAHLDDIGYGGHICFSMDHTGHLEISGVIYGVAMEQYLKFCFNADQTVLKTFANKLAALPGVLCG